MSGERRRNYIFRHCWGLFLVGALIALRSTSLLAADSPPQFVFDSWTTDNGLPQASINDILQTRDGFLWFTTFGGLVRYDGLRFQIFNTGNTKDLRTSRFLQLFEDKEGALWATTEGQGVTRYKDGAFQNYTKEQGLPGNFVRIREDKNGSLLFESGVADRVVVHAWTGGGAFVPYESPDGAPTKSVMSQTPSGGIWHLRDGRLRKFEGGRITVDFEPEFEIKRVYEDSRGRTWIVSSKTVLYMLRDGKLTAYSEADGYPPFSTHSFFEDDKGRVWFGTYNGGLLVFEDEKFTRYTTADGLVGNQVTNIYQDREGIMWVGTTTGLSRLSQRAITAYSAKDGLAADNIYSIYQDRRGKIWIGSWMGLTVFEDGKFENVGKRFGVDHARVMALYEDRAENFWIGTWSEGIFRIKGGRVDFYSPAAVYPSPGMQQQVRAITQDRAGNVWFGTAHGLVKFKDEFFSTLTGEDELAGRAVYALHEDREGRLWIGTENGLCLYKGGVFTSFGEKDGISNHTVRAIYEDRDGTLWFGMYDDGLYRLRDGKFAHFTAREGLFDNSAFQIIEDDRENFWISCNLGIYRVRKADLNSLAEGRIQKFTSIPYNRRDGMLSSECNGGTQPAGIRAAGDGRIWFPTQKGVAVIDPATTSAGTIAPPVVIESLIVDGQTVDFRLPVEIQPKQTYLEIHYSGLSFLNPELVKFKYRLEGLDADWIDAETRRTAYYTHLPPGEYVFRVTAANREGVWNEEGAVVKIKVIPPFWRTWWFFTSAAAAAAAAGFLIYYYRVSALKRRHAAQEVFSRRLIESQEQERKRIASELHDGLGQSLVVIKNRALMSLNAPENHERMLSQVEEIAEAASAAIGEVRGIARNLHPHQLEHLGLKVALETMIQSARGASKTEFSADIDETDGRLSKEVEINLYRVVQESLNNIVKHSEAGAARVSLQINGRTLNLTITDDGKGFAHGAGDPGAGLGLVGIGERAKILGARYEIRSAPEKGTSIFLQLNLPSPQNGN